MGQESNEFDKFPGVVLCYRGGEFGSKEPTYQSDSAPRIA
jgi:hypothetical protein